MKSYSQFKPKRVSDKKEKQTMLEKAIFFYIKNNWHHQTSSYWFVGSKFPIGFKGKEGVEYFKKNGIWQNCNEKVNAKTINSMQTGDLICIKSTFTIKNNDDPIGINLSYVPSMIIKAIGVILKNHKDGTNLDVNWFECGEERIYYLNQVHDYIFKATDLREHTDLVNFSFFGLLQSYQLFTADKWRERYPMFNDVKYDRCGKQCWHDDRSVITDKIIAIENILKMNIKKT